MREDLDDLIVKMRHGGILYQEAVCEFRRAFISAALRANHGNACKAAATLGVHRNSLARLCTELELDAKAFRDSRRRQPAAARAAVLVKRTPR